MSQFFRLTAISGLLILAAVLGAVFVSPPGNGHDQGFARITIGENALFAEVAKSVACRAGGLSGRRSLEAQSGMLFVFDIPERHGFWMKDMEFPIDIIWFRSGRVVDIEERVPPPLPKTQDRFLPVYRPDVSADLALEVNAGFAAKNDIRIGAAASVVYVPRPEVRRGIFGSTSAGSTLVGDLPLTAGEKYFIEMLRAAPPRGRGFEILRSSGGTDAYQKFLISYKSGGLSISGVMNVPKGQVPKGGFPVLILNHGLIRPEIYFSGRGSRREQDFFARRGYITIHPDYRGHASSSHNPAENHDFYVGYTEDVTALVDALKVSGSPLFDVSRIGMWGHSMGGGIAARIMVLRHDVRAYVLFAPISANVEDNFYELDSKDVAWLRKNYGGPGAYVYKKISPLTFFKYVQAPVQVHHGLEDDDVPLIFSVNIAQSLQALGKKVELFLYPGQGHEFIESWLLAAERALQFFDKYVKNAQ